MKIKTSELTGIALDWAVAKCEESIGLDNAKTFLRDHKIGFTTRYSSNWSQGGPIIEREIISIWWQPEDKCWRAADKPWMEADVNDPEWLDGPDPNMGATPLVAAMRCYVASKLGDEVDVPEELL